MSPNYNPKYIEWALMKSDVMDFVGWKAACN